MRIAVIAFSPIAQDARILRQVESLRRRHEVLVIAENPAPAELWGAEFRPLPSEGWLAKRMTGVRRRAGVYAGMQVRDLLCRLTPRYRAAKKHLRAWKPEVILCDEINPLPVARTHHRATGCPVIVDLHEFYPGDTRPGGGVGKYDRPNIDWALHDASRWTFAATAVNEFIAERYRNEYNLNCSTIYNAPITARPPVFRPVNPDCIELVHVSGFDPDRKPEIIAEGVMMAGDPWRLHYYFSGNQKQISAFRDHWHSRSRGRVIVHDTLPVAEIETTIAAYDIGVSMIPTISWNWLMSSPNKYFSFLTAGLGMILGPKPWKQMMNDRWKVAEMTPGFSAGDLAATLQGLTPDRVDQLKQNAVAAAAVLNGTVEGEKLLALCESAAAGVSNKQSAA